MDIVLAHLFPEELWLMLFEQTKNFQQIPFSNSFAYFAAIFSDIVYKNAIADAELLKYLLRYLTLSDVLALRLVNRRCKIELDNLLKDVAKDSNCLRFCRLEPIKLLSGRNGLISEFVGQGLIVDIKTSNDDDNLLQQYLSSHGEKIVRMKLFLHVDSSIEKLYNYLRQTRNVKKIEISAEMNLEDYDGFLNRINQFYHNFPGLLELSQFKDLAIDTKINNDDGYPTNRAILTRCTESLFFNQRQRIESLSLPIHIFNNLSFYTNLTELCSVITYWYSLPLLSSLTRLRKLTLEIDIPMAEMLHLKNSKFEQCQVGLFLSKMIGDDSSLTHLHLWFKRCLCYNYEVPPVFFTLRMKMLKYLTITNGILSPGFPELGNFSTLETIQILMKKRVCLLSPENVPGTAESRAMIWNYVPSLRLFIFETINFERRTYVIEDMKNNPDAQSL